MRSKGLKAVLLVHLAIVAGLVVFLPGSASSQPPFYQGKTITLLQSTQAGDTSDTMTRAIVPLLKKHIPGEPTVKFEFMPGGGGTKAANHIFSNASAGRSYDRAHRRWPGSQRRSRERPVFATTSANLSIWAPPTAPTTGCS